MKDETLAPFNQLVSKSKPVMTWEELVTATEVHPSAVSKLAKALGISYQELKQQIKNGEIEMLP